MNKLKISIELKGRRLRTDCNVNCDSALAIIALARLTLNISKATGISGPVLCDLTKDVAQKMQEEENSEKIEKGE